MGLIQNAINQMTGTIGAVARLSPAYEKSQEGKQITKRGLSAEAGLKDIERSIERVEKSQSGEIPKDSEEYRDPYSQSELKDIKSRVGEHVSAIGALKTAATPGHPLEKYVNRSSLKSRPEYSDMLNRIEKSLNRMSELQDAQQTQRKNFNTYTKLITNPSDINIAFKERNNGK